MAGTIVVDRIESDASYTSTINVANRITFSNTVNFGVTSGAPVAGFYSPSTNNLVFTTASTERMRIDSAGITKFRSTGSAYDSTPGDGVSDGLYLQVDNTGILHIDGYAAGGSTILAFGTNSAGGAVAERMRIDSSGNVQLSTAGTKILNSSGNPILQQTGSILQVVSAFKNDGFSSTSTTFVDITGLSVSITPTSATSKILILVTSNFSAATGNAPTAFNIVRNSTNIATPATAPTYNGTVTPYIAGNISDQSVPWSASFLDSPATTSATTYKVQGRGTSATNFYVNRRATADFNGTSSITVMEIAA
jgi:hypothetical protein